MDKDLNVRPETIKLLKENRQSTLRQSRILYDPPSSVLEIKEKINKWDIIRLKSWENIIANETTDKELISKIYKQLLQLNSRKISDPIKKLAKELNRHFSAKSLQLCPTLQSRGP